MINENIIWVTQLVILPFLLCCLLCFVVFNIFYKQKLNKLKIQIKNNTQKDYLRELFFSTSSIVIFILVIYFSIFHRYLSEKSLLYTEIADFGVGYLIISSSLLIIVHDTYFYWTHRLLHTPFFFKTIHLVHHKSHNPNPLSAFSFHPIEALINIGILPIVIFLFPIHKKLLLIWWFIVVLGNVLGHLGYELFKNKLDKKPFKWFVMSTHHNLHHQKSVAYFGFYFIFWDFLMRTIEKK